METKTKNNKIKFPNEKKKNMRPKRYKNIVFN